MGPHGARLHLLEMRLRLRWGACYGNSVAVTSGGTGCTLRGWWVIAYTRPDHLCNNWMVLFVLHDPGDCLDESIGSFHQRFSLCEWPVKHDGNEHLCSIFLMRAACRPASAPGCAHRDSTLQELDDLLGEYDLKRDLVEINRKAPNGLTMQCGINDIWNQSQVSPCNNCGRTQSRLSESAITQKTSLMR